MSKRWQYKIIEIKPQFLSIKPKQVEETLAQMGVQGWELVQVMPYGQGAWLYLKKEA